VRVIVTRPAAQAAEWVAQLAAHEIAATALPLIEIVPLADPAPLREAWRHLAAHRLVFFVSPNAVERFFAERPDGAAWPAGAFAASPGPGTTRMLVRLGVPPAQTLAPAADAPQFDAEALWTELVAMDWRGASVLIVRGDGGRDGLAVHLRAAGAQVAHLSAYRRAAPAFTPAATALLDEALARPGEHLWFFSSSEAIDHLVASLPGADFGRARAIATHPRIVARARRCGFAAVAETRPTLEAVVACIQSVQP
jgi:uroporphyrinogen-III synthase